MGSVDNQKLQLLESRFWEANESGGHPEEIERGWRHSTSRQDSRASHPYSTRNIDRVGHRTSARSGIDTSAEIDRLKQREAELDIELAAKYAKFKQHSDWLQQMIEEQPDSKTSRLIAHPSIPDPAQIPELQFVSVENDLAPDLVRAMIFKGL